MTTDGRHVRRSSVQNFAVNRLACDARNCMGDGLIHIYKAY